MSHPRTLALLGAALLAGACARSKSETPDAHVPDEADASEQPDIDASEQPDIDAAPEIDATPPVDAPPPPTGTIAEVRALPDGPANVLLEDVYVTYVRTVGFTIQAEQTGPAIFVYTNDVVPTVEVGNLIDLHVTSVLSFNGTAEIDGSTVTANDGGSFDVLANLAQTLTVAPSEDYESELVTIASATVMSGGGRDYVIQYGGGVTANLYAYEASALGLCTGATFGVTGVVGEDTGAYQIASYYAADFTAVDTAGCAVADMSNWNLDSWTTSNPPEDFVNASSGFTSTQEMTIRHGAAGSSANLTWTSTDNQNFVTAYRFPVTPATMYTCHFWWYDDDAAGNGRIFLTWYDAAGVAMSPATFGEYTSDSGAWTELTLQEAAPASAASMTCGVRMYDFGASWDGNATIYVDDFSITTP